MSSRFVILDLQDKFDQDLLLLIMFQQDGTELRSFFSDQLAIIRPLTFLQWAVLWLNFIL